jgi:hypothetical protein
MMHSNIVKPVIIPAQRLEGPRFGPCICPRRRHYQCITYRDLAAFLTRSLPVRSHAFIYRRLLKIVFEPFNPSYPNSIPTVATVATSTPLRGQYLDLFSTTPRVHPQATASEVA